MASYADVLKRSASNQKSVKVEQQDGPANCSTIINNLGFSHITSRIFGHLDHKSQLQCRLVSQSWKNHMDRPLFWLKKLEKKGQSKDLSKAWCNLFQRIEEGSSLEEELRECLMKWFDEYHKWKEPDLDGITPIFIASRFGCLGLVELIASYTANPNMAKTDGWTSIHIAARYGFSELVKAFLLNMDVHLF